MTQKTDCNCEKCAKLCLGRPGVFAPGEATRAAAHLGLSLKDFFDRYLAINYYVAETGNVDFLTPAWKPKIGSTERLLYALGAGTRLEDRPIEDRPMNGRRVTFLEGFTYGRCALLSEKGCTLPFELRPTECREAYACERGDEARGRAQHEAVIEEWRKSSAELAGLAQNE